MRNIKTDVSTIQLLHSLRALQPPQSHYRLPIPVLERLGHGSNRQHTTRGSPSPGPQGRSPSSDPSLRPSGRPATSPAPAISINGPSCSGKTQLLYYVTSVCVLPDSFDGVPLHGLESAVVVLDTDGRFSATRLRTVMRHYITTYWRSSRDEALESSQAALTQLGQLLQAALAHVYVFRPASTEGLLATIASIPAYVFGARAARHSHARVVAAVLLDSAAAFGAQDRHLANHQARLELTRALQGLQRAFSCAVIATSRASHSYSAGAASEPPGYASAWTALFSLRLRTARDVVPKFGPGMSVQEARRDRDSRQSVVDAGGFGCWVDEDEREGDGQKGKRGNVVFKYRILDDGVIVLDESTAT